MTEHKPKGGEPDRELPGGLSEDVIAERAYQIYLSPDRGTADENWRRAETELRRRARSERETGSARPE